MDRPGASDRHRRAAAFRCRTLLAALVAWTAAPPATDRVRRAGAP